MSADAQTIFLLLLSRAYQDRASDAAAATLERLADVTRAGGASPPDERAELDRTLCALVPQR